MSAELALMNQLLQKALKNDVPVSQTDLSFKIPINAGDQPIPEGGEIQIGQDGKAYPVGYNESTATGVVSTSATLATPTYVYQTNISNSGKNILSLVDNYYIHQVGRSLLLYKYDETSGVIKYLKTVSTMFFGDNTYPGTHIESITKLDDTHFIYHYPETSDKTHVVLFTFDKITETLTRRSSAQISATLANTYFSDLVVLDEFRFMWVGDYSGKGYYQCFELAADKNSFTYGSRTLIPVGTNKLYFQVLDYTMGVPNGAYILRTDWVVRCEPKFATGKEVNFYDVTGTAGFDEMIQIPYGNNYNTSLKDLSSRESGESGELLKFNNNPADLDYGKFMLFSFNQTTGEPIVKKYTSLDTIFHYHSSDVYIKSNETTWFCYKVNNDSYSANTGKNHMIFKIVLDDTQWTYKVTVLLNMPTSTLTATDGSTYGLYNKILDYAPDGSLFANIFLYSTQQSESVKVAGNILHYTKTRLRATAPIAADGSGIAIVTGQAFQEVSQSAGSFFLNKFIITDTNYAVEVIQ